MRHVIEKNIFIQQILAYYLIENIIGLKTGNFPKIHVR